jgi:4-hydroxybenzoate polyprenyltransferase
MKPELERWPQADSSVKKQSSVLILAERGEKGGDFTKGWRHWTGSLFKQLRPDQWVKNLLVLAPLLFSRSFIDSTAEGLALAASTSFCLISSAAYIFNDLMDLENDRLHPHKRQRPLASGALNIDLAVAIMALFLLLALLGGWMVGKTFVLVLSMYALVNVLYSTVLKHTVILDIFVIASGFVFRVVGGAVAIDVEISHWLLLCTTLLALFLGFSKRRHELGLLGNRASSHRPVLGEYSSHFLDIMIGVVTACTIMSYALYTVSDDTVRRVGTRGLLFTLPFVVYGIFRYLYLVYQKNGGGDPTRDLLTDRCIAIDVCLYTAAVAVILYWPFGVL